MIARCWRVVRSAEGVSTSVRQDIIECARAASNARATSGMSRISGERLASDLASEWSFRSRAKEEACRGVRIWEVSGTVRGRPVKFKLSSANLDGVKDIVAHRVALAAR